MPVDKNSPVVKLHFFYHREKFQEIDISPSADAVDFYSVMDVERYIGKAIEIAGTSRWARRRRSTAKTKDLPPNMLFALRYILPRKPAGLTIQTV